MSSLSFVPTVLAASTVTTIGAVIVVVLIVGLVIYAIANFFSGSAEVGSEIELAPNRKPYLDDEQLEGPKLNRTLRWALVMLLIIAIGLPLYWLNEPARQSGAVENFRTTFESRGEELFVEGSQCQNCHGPEGTGGQAPYTLLDAEGKFVASVNWRAPALDTVLLRFTEDEVRYIINYGRPFSPMPGWGAAVNKGPLNTQQIDNIIAYLASIQLTPEEAQHQAEVALAEDLGLVEEGASDEEVEAAIEKIDYDDPATGKALFNQDVAGGAYACARCHTRGWSIITTGDDAVDPPDADLSEFTGYPDGSGAFGPNLTGGNLVGRQFATYEDLVTFISKGSADGEAYGRNGIGSGRMPGFGDNPNTPEIEGDGMMTPEMLASIARYEASLPPAETPEPEGAPTVEQLTAVEDGG
jgi:mono/diheme cytochrome c family protein